MKILPVLYTSKTRRVNNPLRVIVGQLNISSVRNEFDALWHYFQAKNGNTFGFWNPNW